MGMKSMLMGALAMAGLGMTAQKNQAPLEGKDAQGTPYTIAGWRGLTGAQMAQLFGASRSQKAKRKQLVASNRRQGRV